MDNVTKALFLGQPVECGPGVGNGQKTTPYRFRPYGLAECVRKVVFEYLRFDRSA